MNEFQYDSKAEGQPLPTETWEQVRTVHLNTPFSQILEAFLAQSKNWKTQPPIVVNKEEWQSAISRQAAAAKEMVKHYKNPDLVMTEPGKIFAQGIDTPPAGEKVLTRIYVGVDPRHGQEVFKALIEQMSSNGCMKDVDIALNTEEIQEGRVSSNTIIIYEYNSRPEVLNKILAAYRGAKSLHPEIFEISPRQKEVIVREALMQFKAVVDANLSFVEMSPEDRNRSWDANIVMQIREAINFNPSKAKNDNEWLDSIRMKERKVVLEESAARALKEGKLKTGDEVHYKRKLTAPALIQTGIIRIE